MISVGNGVIVNLGSLAGQLPRLRNGAYGAAKAAIAHFTKTAALEFSGWGIRVNAVSPGSTFTALLQQAIERDGQPDAAYRVAGNLCGRASLTMASVVWLADRPCQRS
jgi:2,3-dihydro-2,3-dihydroxybenzoate dehydrogenase